MDSDSDLGPLTTSLTFAARILFSPSSTPRNAKSLEGGREGRRGGPTLALAFPGDARLISPLSGIW